MRTIAVALLVGLAGCTLDHRSDELACESTTECSGGRSCIDGYCVEAGAQCPSDCTTCDPAARTCTITGSDSPNGNINCPAGWACTVTCQGGDCRNVDCNQATSCTVTCTGNNACDSVQCGQGACRVTCSGQRACNSVDCRDSCACDVTCADANACENPAQCPATACEAGDGCSSQPPSCSSC